MPAPPVRIAFCITELDPGGAERALVRIVTGLDRQRWQPHVYCLAERGPLASQLDAADVPLTCLNVRSWRDLAAIRRLVRELNTFQPALLQTFMFHGNLAGRIAAWGAKVPIVVAGVRVVEPDAGWRMRLDRWTNRLVDRTICVSRVADRYRELGYRDDQLTVVPNGVDVDHFANAEPADLSEFGIPADSLTILSVGRLHPQKGMDVLLEVFDRLCRDRENHDRLHWLLVGDGPDRQQLEAAVRERGLQQRVHFAGWRQEIAPLLRAGNLFVLSSRWEGMPNVLLEAMAAGTPCVATNVEGVAELITDGQTGLIAEPSDRESLERQMRRMLIDPDLAQQLAAAGQQRVRDQFTWAHTLRGFESVWNDLLAELESKVK